MADEKKNVFKTIAGDKGSKRMLMFLGAVIVGIIGIVVFSGGDEATAQSESRTRSAPNQSDDVISGEVNEAYERVLREADRQRIDEAKNSGKSALPTLTGTDVRDQTELELKLEKKEPEIIRPQVSQPKEVKPIEIPDAPAKVEEPRPTIIPRETVNIEAPTLTPRGGATPQGQPAQPQLVERPQPQTDEALRNLYVQQMARIMQRVDTVPGEPTTAYWYQPPAEMSAAAGSSGSFGASDGGVEMPSAILQARDSAVGTSSQDGEMAAASAGSVPSGSASELPFKAPLAGDIIYATMVTRADSDAPGPIVAKILQGDLAGARLLGNFSLSNEKLMLEFSSISIGETMSGKKVDGTFPIRAVAVDTAHVGTGIATSVDRHLLSRVAVKASTAFLSGLGTAISESGQTVSNLGDGQSEVATAERSMRSNALIAGGAAAQETGNIIDEYLGARPTTVRVEANTPLGILFLE